LSERTNDISCISSSTAVLALVLVVLLVMFIIIIVATCLPIDSFMRLRILWRITKDY